MEKFAQLAILLIVLILIIFLSIIFFGRDSYRYECQDPEMWSMPVCNPPICETSGTCTKDIIHRVEKVAIDEGITDEKDKK